MSVTYRVDHDKLTGRATLIREGRELCWPETVVAKDDKEFIAWNAEQAVPLVVEDIPPVKDRERLREILAKARDQIVDEYLLDEFERRPDEMQAIFVRLGLADTVREGK